MAAAAHDTGQARRHAEAVGASLAGAGGEVRWLALPDLPDKGDVFDWIAGRESQGGTTADIRRDLLQLAAAAPLATDLALQVRWW